MSAELLELAQRLVALDHEAEEVRNAMRRLLSNGLGGGKPRPTSRPHKGRERTGPEGTSAAEAQILAALKDKPMRHGEVVRATGQKASSTGLRLQRLERRGLIQRGAEGAWTVSSP
jgi:hypothetical protein